MQFNFYTGAYLRDYPFRKSAQTTPFTPNARSHTFNSKDSICQLAYESFSPREIAELMEGKRDELFFPLMPSTEDPDRPLFDLLLLEDMAAERHNEALLKLVAQKTEKFLLAYEETIQAETEAAAKERSRIKNAKKKERRKKKREMEPTSSPNASSSIPSLTRMEEGEAAPPPVIQIPQKNVSVYEEAIRQEQEKISQQVRESVASVSTNPSKNAKKKEKRRQKQEEAQARTSVTSSSSTSSSHVFSEKARERFKHYHQEGRLKYAKALRIINQLRHDYPVAFQSLNSHISGSHMTYHGTDAQPVTSVIRHGSHDKSIPADHFNRFVLGLLESLQRQTDEGIKSTSKKQ